MIESIVWVAQFEVIDDNRHALAPEPNYACTAYVQRAMEGHRKVWPHEPASIAGIASSHHRRRRRRNNEPNFLFSFFHSVRHCRGSTRVYRARRISLSIGRKAVVAGQRTDGHVQIQNDHRFALLIINRARYSS